MRDRDQSFALTQNREEGDTTSDTVAFLEQLAEFACKTGLLPEQMAHARPTDNSSREIRWVLFILARARIPPSARRRSSESTSGKRMAAAFNNTCNDGEVARLRQFIEPGRGQFHLFIFESRRLTSSARGSLPLSSARGRGNNMRDLISSIAAIRADTLPPAQNAATTSSSPYSRYWCVSAAIGMSRMLRFCLRIR